MHSFVLERHLKREEVIQPKREVGRFRGEPVYRRANVHSCKTAENWMRVGRKVKHRQDPMKWVKQRAMTLNRRREVELAKQNGEEQMQGLYAEWQTEVFTPPPIKDVS
jgi:xeroderma pigmentosum group C-complementing protein